jgi:hypothetical protein
MQIFLIITNPKLEIAQLYLNEGMAEQAVVYYHEILFSKKK